MSALICGSFAFDTIMVFPGHFKNEILPDKVHILNVAFLVPQLRREYGGTAGNIAYNLKLLGGDALPMGTVGADFDRYAEWLDENDIPRDYIKTVPETYTAQAYITTDLDDNQITAFHPGAMNHAHIQAVPEQGIKIGTVSPDGREGMIQHARQFAEAGIPFVFDPGQGLPMFNGAELRTFIEQASYVAVNDYESELLMDRTDWSLKEIAARVDALIVTRGGKGAHIHTANKVHDVPCAKADSLTDPTGCGDAFRGGLLYGLMQGMDWPTIGRIASLMGAYNIERPGTQNHRFDLEQFRSRFKEEFRFDFA
ncbi:carbohydrate kinase family protein [Sinimarinibacterium sp. CAU 1509]|uniref:carbohydrate kinase family protein n=1 Tax=Sinimarinibacterium sp. CAU 1509 TaxID=2562283 RepID=UPI0010AD5F39|nr:carbohydrate kinase family protein [Sinimarinibacterium sp. CAU 1509]TJY61047.1 carbohydrate kinase family protein [Sinimarinibacterium sp. CAU 1509]